MNRETEVERMGGFGRPEIKILRAGLESMAECLAASQEPWRLEAERLRARAQRQPGARYYLEVQCGAIVGAGRPDGGA